MHVFLFDDEPLAEQLKPFTFTRPVALIRMGIFTMKERWDRMLGTSTTIWASERLSALWPKPAVIEGIWINASWIPTPKEADRVRNLAAGHALVKGEVLLAFHQSNPSPINLSKPLPIFFTKEEVPDAFILTRPWEIFKENGRMIRTDFDLISQSSSSAKIQDPFTRIYHEDQVFVEEGADVKAAIINASGGPVYIGKNAQIQEGSIIQGPFALCEGAVVNVGAKIRPDCTVGPMCKVGGELNNSVFFGYSNKAHDGFLGNSVIGEWCNLGADTNNSNLKNNYGNVKVFSYAESKLIDTGLQFCGLLMGDHSKTGINSMLNTGTVVGVGSNIFDSGFPPKHVPGFSWGSAHNGFELYRFEKFLEVERRVFARRKRELSSEYISILETIFRECETIAR